REYSVNNNEKLEIREKFLIADKLIESLSITSRNLDSKFTSKLINTQEIKTSLTTFKKHPDFMYTTRLINTLEILDAYSRSIEINKAGYEYIKKLNSLD
ncbi:13531_t:CDS:2, partial [Cetraspora pellucida]